MGSHKMFSMEISWAFPTYINAYHIGEAASRTVSVRGEEDTRPTTSLHKPCAHLVKLDLG